jgi:hypothetical protein
MNHHCQQRRSGFQDEAAVAAAEQEPCRLGRPAILEAFAHPIGMERGQLMVAAGGRVAGKPVIKTFSSKAKVLYNN